MNASCFPQNPWWLNGYRAALARSSYPEEKFQAPNVLIQK
jgi:hypothetical protein